MTKAERIKEAIEEWEAKLDVCDALRDEYDNIPPWRIIKQVRVLNRWDRALQEAVACHERFKRAEDFE